MNDKQLSPPERRVAITGGAQGIGRGIALAFARRGYRVSVIDPDPVAGAELLDLLAPAGLAAEFHVGDVASEADIATWLSQTQLAFGATPGLLINNAGIMIRKPLVELSLEEFDRVLAVNLRGCFACSQAFARAWIAHAQPGCIVNVASTRARMSEPDTEAYSASKGGILALTHAMAISLGGHGIRVNSISPGWIETADWQVGQQGKAVEHSREDRAQHPVGRVGRPEDVAEACAFLAESAGFVTGQDLIVDGGMTVKMIYA